MREPLPDAEIIRMFETARERMLDRARSTRRRIAHDWASLQFEIEAFGDEIAQARAALAQLATLRDMQPGATMH